MGIDVVMGGGKKRREEREGRMIHCCTARGVWSRRDRPTDRAIDRQTDEQYE